MRPELSRDGDCPGTHAPAPLSTGGMRFYLFYLFYLFSPPTSPLLPLTSNLLPPASYLSTPTSHRRYEVYEAMAMHPLGSVALESWFPAHSGLRTRIEAIHSAFPDGFVRLPPEITEGGSASTSGADADEDYDMGRVELALRRYRSLRSAKIKLKAALLFVRLAREAAERRAVAEGRAPKTWEAAQPAAVVASDASSFSFTDWFSNRVGGWTSDPV